MRMNWLKWKNLLINFDQNFSDDVVAIGQHLFLME